MSSGSGQKIVCVLYDDPVAGFPPDYARDGIPALSRYPDGQALPSPSSVDFTPGHLLGSVSGGLGLAPFLTARGHEFIVTSDKDGPDSVFERELVDADVVISQPFWPAYLTAERIDKAPNLKMAITAGIGSDHVDLQAAINRGITVAEVTWCNSISVAEHAVMQMLALVRDYIPQYGWVMRGGWNIADAASRSYDIEGMDVGVVAAGRIGLAVLKRMKPFDVNLHYTDRHRLPADVEAELGRDLPPHRRIPGQRLRRGQHPLPVAPRNRGHVQRRAHRQDEARLVHRQHRPRQDLQPRCHRARPGERPACLATPATSGSPSPRPTITPGAPCPTTP